MTRILVFATTYFPLVGGAEVALKEVTDRMPSIQFDLICAKIKPGLPATEQIGNITVHRVGVGKSIDKFLLPVFGVKKALTLGTFPVIWSLMASFGGFAALAYTWVRPTTRLLLTLQEGDPLEHYDRRAGLLSGLHRLIFRRANAVQAISHFLAKWATDMGFQGEPVVVPNGVDLRTFLVSNNDASRETLRTRFGFNRNDVVLVTASRLSHKNAVDDLITALTHLPENHKALLLGVGEDEEKLRTLAEKKGVGSRVIFAGSVSHAELPAHLQCADIFIRASRSEGLGNAFLEAMACGLPIIGTRVGGIPDFLTDGETGVFCDVDQPASIAKAVQRICDDATLRARLIENGRALVKEHYGWDGIAVRVQHLLERVEAAPIVQHSSPFFQRVVLLIAVSTVALAAVVGVRAWGLYPLYTDAVVRNDVKSIMTQLRDETGFGLSKLLIQSIRCKGGECAMKLTIRTRLAPPNPTTETTTVRWQKGQSTTYDRTR